jgi:hypothetical protein
MTQAVQNYKIKTMFMIPWATLQRTDESKNKQLYPPRIVAI